MARVMSSPATATCPHNLPDGVLFLGGTDGGTNESRFGLPDNWKVLAAVLLGLSIVIYLPTFSAGFIWDDPDYIVNNANLRDWAGLKATWLQPRSLPQWYPLVHTTFWVEYHLWGLWAPGYHMVNVVVHALGAVALAWVLRQIGLPARVAFLGALLWSVHPVQVESVAWVTERKNTLSALLYLLSFAMLIQWHRRSPRGGWWWSGALVLFAAALASKTITASLPAAWLLVLYWKRGKLGLADVVPVLPFFVLGAMAGRVTATMEVEHVGAQGAEWAFSFADRCLIAGRGTWFYLGKLAAPFNLAFIYERWTIDSKQLWQWVFPITALTLLLTLFAFRNRIGRGPFVAFAFFVGTLFPALGFFNVYPFRYSFVADHFQHLASVSPLLLVAVLLARAPKAFSVGVVAALCVLTLFQCRIYQNTLTLWQDTVAKSPGSWMAYINLGNAYWERADENPAYRQRAFESVLRARDVAPRHPDTQTTVGDAYVRFNRFAEAKAAYETAIELDAKDARPENGLGKLLLLQGDLAGAEKHMRRALELQPAFHLAHANLGTVLERQGRYGEAADEYVQAIRSDPRKAEFRVSLGKLLLGRALAKGDRALLQDAAGRFSEALTLEPENAEALLGAGQAAMAAGDRERGAAWLERAARNNPALLEEVHQALQR